MRYLLGLSIMLPQITFACSAITPQHFLANIFITGSVITFLLTTLGAILFVITTRMVLKYRIKGTSWLFKGIAYIYGTVFFLFIFLYGVFVGLVLYANYIPGMSLSEVLNHNACDEWMKISETR